MFIPPNLHVSAHKSAIIRPKYNVIKKQVKNWNIKEFMSTYFEESHDFTFKILKFVCSMVIDGKYRFMIVIFLVPSKQRKGKCVHLKVQGGSNMTGTDLCVNKPHCAAAV